MGGDGIFLPGWGATAALYRRGLPAGWEALELPSFRLTGGVLDAYVRRLADELERRPAPAALAGHSLGAALAVLAAAARPEAVARLVLLAPAGLPYEKRLRASARALGGQILRGCYPARELARAAAAVAVAPRAALRLAGEVHDLDVSPALSAIRAQAVPCTVVGCLGDELATPAHCRRLAELVGGRYREVRSPEGHIWPITDPQLLRRVLGNPAAPPDLEADRQTQSA